MNGPWWAGAPTHYPPYISCVRGRPEILEVSGFTVIIGYEHQSRRAGATAIPRESVPDQGLVYPPILKVGCSPIFQLRVANNSPRFISLLQLYRRVANRKYAGLITTLHRMETRSM